MKGIIRKWTNNDTTEKYRNICNVVGSCWHWVLLNMV